MHLPSYHAEFRTAVLQQFIEQNPLGILTTVIRHPSFPLLQTSHIPWVIDIGREPGTEYGKLRGHIARQNPQAKAIIEHVEKSTDGDNQYLEEDILILFNAPVHHYVTPKFYKETKPSTGKVVPTWDYEAVQVYGKARVFTDSRSEVSKKFLTKQIADLSQHAETSVMGYGAGDKSNIRPWSVSDAPERYIDLLMKNIIGIEVEITSMVGRFKMSQEKPKADREGVIEGMRSLDKPYGAPMAEMLSHRASEFDELKSQKSS